MTGTQAEAGFSRVIAVDDLRFGDERTETFSADHEERRKVALAFDLASLDRLEASVRLKRIKSGAVRAEFTYGADVQQTCVVTLEPVKNTITETFHLVFEPADKDGENEPPTAVSDVDVIIENDDPPEQMHGNRFDAGQFVVEFLALALDPYPRKEGIRLEEVPEYSLLNDNNEPTAESRNTERDNPFSVLRRLTETTSRNS